MPLPRQPCAPSKRTGHSRQTASFPSFFFTCTWTCSGSLNNPIPLIATPPGRGIIIQFFLIILPLSGLPPTMVLARHFFLLILHWACGISYVEFTPRSLLHAGTRSSDKFLSALVAVMAHKSVAWGQESFLSCSHADPESTHCTPTFWQSECFNRKHACFFSCHVCGQRIWAYVQVSMFSCCHMWQYVIYIRIFIYM